MHENERRVTPGTWVQSRPGQAAARDFDKFAFTISCAFYNFRENSWSTHFNFKGRNEVKSHLSALTLSKTCHFLGKRVNLFDQSKTRIRNKII